MGQVYLDTFHVDRQTTPDRLLATLFTSTADRHVSRHSSLEDSHLAPTVAKERNPTTSLPQIP